MSASIIKGREALSKARARRIERLAAEVDRVLETDRRFFARRPDRSHRVRLASRAETDFNREVQRGHTATPPGCSNFVAVKQILPGVRTRVFLFGKAGSPTDLSEEVAKRIFDNILRNTGAVLDDEGRRV